MTYVISDVHGSKNRFENIMQQINLQDEDTLYILGDIIDRGEFGIELLDKIRTMPNVIMLLGNHEYMMRNYLKDPDDFGNLLTWMCNGANPTLRALDYKDDEYIDDLINYLHRLPTEVELTVKGRSYNLSHAAPKCIFENCNQEGYYKNEDEFAVWYRMPDDAKDLDKVLDNALDKDTTYIIGHTPTMLLQDYEPAQIWEHDNLMDIDCGCAYDGRLACIRLEDMKVFYSCDEACDEACDEVCDEACVE